MFARNHTPVRSPRGRKIHAVLMSGESVTVTVCRRRFTGWSVATEPVNCTRCLELVGEPVAGGAPA